MKHDITKTNSDLLDQDSYYELHDMFTASPKIIKPLYINAKHKLDDISRLIQQAPSFIEAIQASLPEASLQVVLTNDQRKQLANGALSLMVKKDGSLLAKLVHPKTKKMISNLPLETVKITPELSTAMTSFASQMQLAAIAEQIQQVQIVMESIKLGQEHDRLALGYSCQQKLFQALAIQEPTLKQMALLQVVSDAEDSRNLLMLSQNEHLRLIKNEPKSILGKIKSGATPVKIKQAMDGIRESLYVINMVSLAEVVAYQSLGEPQAAQESLNYYANFLERVYLKEKGFVERLDLIDPIPDNYFTTKIEGIKKSILALPYKYESYLIEVSKDDKQNL